MAFPTYRQDFEGGTTLATACPELVDIDSQYSIDSTGAHAFTGTHSLKLAAGAAHTIITNVADTLSGDVTVSAYFNVSSSSASIDVYAQGSPSAANPTSFQRASLGSNGIAIVQNISSAGTTLNTPISGAALPTGVWLCLELRCHGSTISSRVVRQDTGQFFVNSGSGSWSSSPPAYDASNRGTATLAEAAGSFGIRSGDLAGLWVDDLIYGPAVPSIDNPTFSLSGAGLTQQLTAGGFTDPLFGVTWSSSNTGVATVSSAGLVTAVAAGTATITATGKRDTTQAATATATITTGAATLYTVTPPSPASGFANNLSGAYTIHLDGIYTGTITATPTTGFGLSPITKTYSASSADQTFNFTPTAAGVITWTFTNSDSLGNPGTTSYTVNAQTLAISPSSVALSSVTTFTATGGGTLWQSGGAPTLPESGLAGFTVSNIVVSSNTSLTFTGTAPVLAGTATITDNTTGATAAIAVAATYAYLSVVGNLAAGQAAGYTLYPGNSSTPYQARSTAGVIELGHGIYQVLVGLPINAPMTFVWDDTQGRYVPDSVCPALSSANNLDTSVAKLFGTGTVTAVTNSGSFTVSFDQPYQGNTASLTDRSLYLSFTSGLNQWHSKPIGGGTLTNPTAAALTFSPAFGQTVAVGDTFTIVSA